MTTANPESRPTRSPDSPADPGVAGRPARPAHRSARPGWYATLRDALDRPLTSYYLLLGASALLLTIGLIMVLSASSVYSYKENDGGLLRGRQAPADVGGARPALRLDRQPAVRSGWIRGSPGRLLRLARAAPADRVPRRLRNGNQNWLALGPVVIQPSEIAKLALILWAAHVYAHKDRRLGSLHQVMMPVVPGLLLAIALVVVGRDLGTALVLFAILLGMLWVVGAPARFFVLCISLVGVGGDLPGLHQPERLEPHHELRRPVQGLPRHRLAARARPLRAVHRRLVRPGHRRQPAEVGRPARGAHRLHLRRARRGARPGRHAAGDRLFLTIAYAAIRVAPRPPTRSSATPFGIIVWLLGQMIINVGMVLALLPVIGIPLPLVSYGGSALLPSLVALGLLIGFARASPRPPARWPSAAARRRGLSAGVPPRALDRVTARFGSMRVLLAGGGTAGHTSPLLATADALRRPRPRPSRSPASARPAGSRTAWCPRPATRSS